MDCEQNHHCDFSGYLPEGVPPDFMSDPEFDFDSLEVDLDESGMGNWSMSYINGGLPFNDLSFYNFYQGDKCDPISERRCGMRKYNEVYFVRSFIPHDQEGSTAPLPEQLINPDIAPMANWDLSYNTIEDAIYACRSACEPHFGNAGCRPYCHQGGGNPLPPDTNPQAGQTPGIYGPYAITQTDNCKLTTNPKSTRIGHSHSKTVNRNRGVTYRTNVFAEYDKYGMCCIPSSMDDCGMCFGNSSECDPCVHGSAQAYEMQYGIETILDETFKLLIHTNPESIVESKIQSMEFVTRGLVLTSIETHNINDFAQLADFEITITNDNRILISSLSEGNFLTMFSGDLIEITLGYRADFDFYNSFYQAGYGLTDSPRICFASASGQAIFDNDLTLSPSSESMVLINTGDPNQGLYLQYCSIIGGSFQTCNDPQAYNYESACDQGEIGCEDDNSCRYLTCDPDNPESSENTDIYGTDHCDQVCGPCITEPGSISSSNDMDNPCYEWNGGCFDCNGDIYGDATLDCASNCCEGETGAECWRATTCMGCVEPDIATEYGDPQTYYFDGDNDSICCNIMTAELCSNNPLVQNNIYKSSNECTVFENTETACLCPTVVDNCGVCGGDDASCGLCCDANALNYNDECDGGGAVEYTPSCVYGSEPAYEVILSTNTFDTWLTENYNPEVHYLNDFLQEYGKTEPPDIYLRDDTDLYLGQNISYPFDDEFYGNDPDQFGTWFEQVLNASAPCDPNNLGDCGWINGDTVTIRTMDESIGDWIRVTTFHVNGTWIGITDLNNQAMQRGFGMRISTASTEPKIFKWRLPV
tara:strand:- start:946 stop:3390 length:2445 start_codon:yes stop_codon:yes gene_type:complete